MKLYFIALLTGLSFLNFSFLSFSLEGEDALTALQLNPYGRFDYTANKELELISSAVHFGFSFNGSICRLYVSIPKGSSHNYLQYELDGVYQRRIRIEEEDKQPIVINVPTTGKHQIRIFKATEAHTGPIFIKKVVARDIKSLRNSSAPLIEFIGNSITCGAASDPSETPCGTGVYQDQHNAYQAYGPRVARALNVNYILSSVSGIGIYRNWNSDGPAMPSVYEKIDFQESSLKMWKFETYNPRIVSIALGTNDFSNGDGKTKRLPFDSTAFINSYVKFVTLVKLKYPKAQIALLSSPMVKGTSRTKLQDCLTAVKVKADKNYPKDPAIALFFFEPMEARGCAGHPSVEDHAILANQLQQFFAGLLGKK